MSLHLLTRYVFINVYNICYMLSCVCYIVHIYYCILHCIYTVNNIYLLTYTYVYVACYSIVHLLVSYILTVLYSLYLTLPPTLTHAYTIGIYSCTSWGVTAFDKEAGAINDWIKKYKSDPSFRQARSWTLLGTLLIILLLYIIMYYYCVQCISCVYNHIHWIRICVHYMYMQFCCI